MSHRHPLQRLELFARRPDPLNLAGEAFAALCVVLILPAALWLIGGAF